MRAELAAVGRAPGRHRSRQGAVRGLPPRLPGVNSLALTSRVRVAGALRYEAMDLERVNLNAAGESEGGGFERAFRWWSLEPGHRRAAGQGSDASAHRRRGVLPPAPGARAPAPGARPGGSGRAGPSRLASTEERKPGSSVSCRASRFEMNVLKFSSAPLERSIVSDRASRTSCLIIESRPAPANTSIARSRSCSSSVEAPFALRVSLVASKMSRNEDAASWALHRIVRAFRTTSAAGAFG